MDEPYVVVRSSSNPDLHHFHKKGTLPTGWKGEVLYYFLASSEEEAFAQFDERERDIYVAKCVFEGVPAILHPEMRSPERKLKDTQFLLALAEQNVVRLRTLVSIRSRVVGVFEESVKRVEQSKAAFEHITNTVKRVSEEMRGNTANLNGDLLPGVNVPFQRWSGTQPAKDHAEYQAQMTEWNRQYQSEFAVQSSKPMNERWDGGLEAIAARRPLPPEARDLYNEMSKKGQQELDDAVLAPFFPGWRESPIREVLKAQLTKEILTRDRSFVPVADTPFVTGFDRAAPDTDYTTLTAYGVTRKFRARRFEGMTQDEIIGFLKRQTEEMRTESFKGEVALVDSFGLPREYLTGEKLTPEQKDEAALFGERVLAAMRKHPFDLSEDMEHVRKQIVEGLQVPEELLLANDPSAKFDPFSPQHTPLFAREYLGRFHDPIYLLSEPRKQKEEHYEKMQNTIKELRAMAKNFTMPVFTARQAPVETQTRPSLHYEGPINIFADRNRAPDTEERLHPFDLAAWQAESPDRKDKLPFGVWEEVRQMTGSEYRGETLGQELSRKEWPVLKEENAPSTEGLIAGELVVLKQRGGFTPRTRPSLQGETERAPLVVLVWANVTLPQGERAFNLTPMNGVGYLPHFRPIYAVRGYSLPEIIRSIRQIENVDVRSFEEAKDTHEGYPYLREGLRWLEDKTSEDGEGVKARRLQMERTALTDALRFEPAAPKR